MGKPTSPHFNGQAGKFVNLTPDRLNLYWDSGRGRGHFTGPVNGFEATGTATFPSHNFFFGKTDNPNDALCRFKVKPKISTYYCNPYAEIAEPYWATVSERRSLALLNEYDTMSEFPVSSPVQLVMCCDL